MVAIVSSCKHAFVGVRIVDYYFHCGCCSCIQSCYSTVDLKFAMMDDRTVVVTEWAGWSFALATGVQGFH